MRLEATEAVLNHGGGRGGIVGIYERHAWVDERRAALEAWAQLVEGLVNPKQRRQTWCGWLTAHRRPNQARRCGLFKLIEQGLLAKRRADTPEPPLKQEPPPETSGSPQ